MPKGSNKGTPSAKKKTSVVVPPISNRTASSFVSIIACIPIKLAAGPERIDSIGILLAAAKFIKPPSAFKI